MRGLLSLKVEKPFLFHDVARSFERRGLIQDWWAIVTPASAETILRADGAPISRLLSFKEFLDLGGDPTNADVDELERRYGTPTLWTTIIPDRRLYSPDPRIYAHNAAFRGYDHQQILRVTGRALRAAERVLDELRPEVVLLESAASVDECALFRVATARNIAAVFLTHSRIRNRWFWTRSEKSLSPEITATAQALRRGEARPPTPEESAFALDVIKGISDRNEATALLAPALEWMGKTAAVEARRVLRFPLRAARMFLSPDPSAKDNPYAQDPWRQVPDRLGLRWRRLRDRSLVPWEKPVPGERFAYFPLHMQPEVTSTVWAPGYLDHVNLVDLIARSIPVTWKLYVKEHPIMRGHRHHDFYRRLKRNPNVRLIDPAVSSNAAIREAQLVLSVTGTAAWEAAVIGRPAILFGPTSFDGCRGIGRFDGAPERLASFIRGVLDGKGLEGEYDPTDYIVAVLRHSFPADSILVTDRPGMAPAHEIERVAEALVPLLGPPPARRAA